MTFNAERQAIEQFFETNYTPPAGVNIYHESVPNVIDTAINITLLVRSGEQSQIGLDATSALFRNEGFIVFEVRTPIQRGSGDALNIIDDISELFRKQEFSGITIGSMVPDRIGIRDNWFQVNLLINFRRDEFI